MDKPAGIATEPDRRGGESLRDRVGDWLRREGRFVRTPHAVSRLDVGVTGAVVFATDDVGTSRFVKLREAGAYERVYLAFAAGEIEGEGAWNAPIDGKAARTEWRAVDRGGAARRRITLVAARPRTGRTHQIRIHASLAGAALVGDKRYGGPTSVASPRGAVIAVKRPFLHAVCVRFPSRGGAPVEVRAPIPDDFLRTWSALDGRAEAWEEALVACGVGFSQESSAPP